MPDLAVNGMARPLATYPLAPGVEAAFVPRGTVVEPTPGVVVLDVGGGLCQGVVDHHQPGSGRLCASELVVRQPDLVLDPFVFDADPVVLLTHFAPDLDAACSVFFAWRLLADRALPDGAVALARYVGDIDRGMVFAQDGFTETLYGVFTVMAQDILDAAAENGQDGGEASAEVLKAGFGLLNDLMGRLDAGTDLHRERLFDHARFRPLTDRLKDDAWTYRRDVERAVTKHVVLPKRGGGTMEVGALFIDDPESLFFKHWARSDRERDGFPDGFPLLAVAYGGRRYVISLPIGHEATLRGLGELLEGMETREREVLGLVRKGPVRPGYGTVDPWYDGRNAVHDYSIVDTPSGGTVLSRGAVFSAVEKFGANL